MNKQKKKFTHFAGHILELVEGNEMDTNETWCYDEIPFDVLQRTPVLKVLPRRSEL
jgi:hypothetical protein